MGKVIINWENPKEVDALFEKVRSHWREFHPDEGVFIAKPGVTKTLVVNWSSFEEVGKAFNKIKARYEELRKLHHPELLLQKQETLDACVTILETDISSVYGDLALDSSPRYYVYAHMDPNRKVAVGKHGITSFAAVLGCGYFPFYIGKGTGNRCYDISRNGEHAKIAKRLRILDNKIEVHKIKDNLTESEALQLESKLIDIFGLRPYGGMLSNLDEGMRSQQRRSLYREAFLKLKPFNVKLIS
jgi:hypothetical protein